MSEPERQKIASTLKETFGDLFDRKELARMGVLMLGGMITGMSPGQALAFAGTQYLNRLDAKESNHDAMVKSLVTGGEYTPDSIAVFKETGDPSVLMKAEALQTMEETGQQKTAIESGVYSPPVTNDLTIASWLDSLASSLLRY